jgi:hypothetical protein
MLIWRGYAVVYFLLPYSPKEYYEPIENTDFSNLVKAN